MNDVDTSNGLNQLLNEIDIIHERKLSPITLTPLETAAIKAQDSIGWDHFIRGRIANNFAPVIQQYYSNNKIRSFSAPLRWSKSINKCNFATHQTAWKNYCAEIVSPDRSKKNLSQRKLYLLSLVEKYYSQVSELPQLQSQWFSRPITKYRQWRAQELINWIRTAKRIIRKNRTKQKNLKENLKKNEDYTVLDDTTALKTKTRSKSRIHSIHRIPDKAELDKMSNSLISNYFPTRDNVQNSDQSEQPVTQMLNQTESLCSLP